jgi:hypothetical protein
VNHKLSGSKYHLALLCAYPFRPDVVWPDRPAGTSAKVGNATHAIVEVGQRRRIERNPYLADPVVDCELEAYPLARRANAWLDEVSVPRAVEVAIIYDAATDTARLAPSGGHREYGALGPMEIPTTLDLVWTDAEEVTVRDLKTGQKRYAHVEQLYIQALAASRLYGLSRAKVGFLWARKTKCEADSLEDLGPGELEAESWRAASVMRRLPVAQPEPGDHCFSCPLGREMCPAHSREADESLQAAGE